MLKKSSLVPALSCAFALALGLGSACGSDSKKSVDAGSTGIDASGACVGTSAAELISCIEKSRLEADIVTISKERVPGSAHWKSVQDMCKDRFESAGFAVSLENYGSGINVIGRKTGTSPGLGEVVVSAHYDHIEGCPGASDNGAGVAAVLEIARLLGKRESKHPLVVACWDEEERGLIGSKAYADKAKAESTKISAMYSFDSIGYFSSEAESQSLPAGFGVIFPEAEAKVKANDSRGDFLAVISDEASAATVARVVAHAQNVGLSVSELKLSEALKLSGATASLRRSDHASFWQNDFPAVHFTDTADFRNPNYHCFNGQDTPDTLNMDFVTQTSQVALGAAVDALDEL